MRFRKEETPQSPRCSPPPREALSEMSSGAPGILSVNKTAESPVSGSGNKRRDSLGSASSCPIFKDVGEIYSRLLDHRPVIQGEIRYFIKEFELQTEKLRAAEAQRIADWEGFMKEQHRLKTMVNEEHTKAMEHLKEQYAALEKDLPKQAL
uniref:Biogenesis of lysosome-related organelles complex 1 subunit 5 n=1 Tax=Laticauda laticaudata TaxID=8630 RepID=A0A8C5SK06_LATLA